MEKEINSLTDSEFYSKLDGNILIIGPTNSGKTSLIQKWALNSMFSIDLEHVYWVSSLYLDIDRKNEIDSFFKQNVKFAKVSDRNDMQMFIEDLKNLFDSQHQHPNHKKDEMIGEKSEFNKLVVFDDMSTIADKSKDFSHFLTVSRKYGYICIYVLHNLSQNNNDIWQLILSNTSIVVLFKTVTISSPIVNILYQNAKRNTSKYIPRQDLWLFNVYKDINNSQNQHLMIDNRDVNSDTLGRFRSNTFSNVRQICYFAMEGNDRRYNRYIATPIKKII